MTLNEIFWMLASMLVAGLAVVLVAFVVFGLMAACEFVRCRICKIPFELPFQDFMTFVTESLMPTVALMGLTLIILKICFGAGGK